MLATDHVCNADGDSVKEVVEEVGRYVEQRISTDALRFLWLGWFFLGPFLFATMAMAMSMAG